MSETNDRRSGTRGRCPFWMRVLLVASLAGNIAVAGLFGGMALRGGEDDGHDGLDPRQARILRVLPEDQRDEARAVMRAGLPALDESRSRMRAVHRRIVAEIRGTPDFSPERLGGALEERREASTEVNRVVHGQLVEIVSAMTPEERAETADRLERIIERFERKRDRSE